VDIILSIGLPEPLTQPQKNFLALLAENNRLGWLSVILELYEQFWMEARQSVVARVFSAEKFDSDILQTIKQRLEQNVKLNIHLETHIDPTILAGARIEIGDRVIDGSLQTALHSLRKALTHY